MASILGAFGDQVIAVIKEAISNDKSGEIKKHQVYTDTIVVNNFGEILLLKRSTLDTFMPGKWGLPGGKLESGENPTESAQRELLEETGIAAPCEFIKTYEKDNCTIHYFQTRLGDEFITLDNEEHFQYEFASFEKLQDYDLLFDLGEILKELQPFVHMPLFVSPQASNIEEMIAIDHDFISKSFNEGLIEDDDYLLYMKHKDSWDLIKSAHSQGLVSDAQLFDLIEKAKHYEYVKVNRDGKTFLQYREVGTDEVVADMGTGDTADAASLGLVVKKYTDKSFLITGDTYKNLELLRSIKKELGDYGSWNKALNGWVFPLFGKEKILAMLAAKMPEGTYEEKVAKEATIDLKNSLDIGTTVIVNNEEAVVTDVTTDETGAVQYTTENQIDGVDVKVVTENEVAIPPASDEKAVDLINNANEENRAKTGKELTGKEVGEKPASADIEEAGEKGSGITTKDFTTRSGAIVNALDFTGVQSIEIQLPKQEDILDKPKPYYIPDINEYNFSGAGDNKFVFDYVKLDDNKFLLALNGYNPPSYSRSNPRLKDSEHKYAVVSLDNLVVITEYYQMKRRAELKKEVDQRNAKAVADIANWTESAMNYYKPFNYTRLSDKQKKKYTEEQWQNLSVEEKLAEVPNMKNKPVSFKGSPRISPLDDNRMLVSNFHMYKEMVNTEYVLPKGSFSHFDECALEYREVRDQLKWKKIDLQIQREDNDSSYSKGRETSYGDVNVQDDLLESHGVKIKTQNGKPMVPGQIEDIKMHLGSIYDSFGNRSSMAKEFGLKISHAGDTRMHASKASGFYVPSMKAIGVGNSFNSFGFTLAHEFGHFIDNYAGRKQGKHFASDDYNSTAGQIASQFRRHMNKYQDSDYMNRTCECFARAFEQYHAIKSVGHDAIRFGGKKYYETDEQVNREKFETHVVPLIEKFLSENDHILKSAIDELSIVDSNLDPIIKANEAFDIMKFAFDEDQVDLNTFIDFAKKYDKIVKGDPTHGGKLVKKTGVDKMGKKTTKWVKRGDSTEEKKDSSESQSGNKEPVAHTKNVLSAFAKETPAAELKRVVNDSHDHKLRAAAQAELHRREKEEKPQEKKDGSSSNSGKKKASEVADKDSEVKFKDPLDAVSKIKSEYKDDKLMTASLDFLEPILKANSHIQFDSKYKFKNNQVLGYSFPDGRLAINFKAMEGDEDNLNRTTVHEMIHAVTRYEIANNHAFNDELRDILSEVRSALNIPDNDSLASLMLARNITDTNYGATNEHEMIAEIFSNQKFYNFLSGIQYKGDSMLKRVITRIAGFFSKKYRKVNEAKSNIKATDLAGYLVELTQGVINNSKFKSYSDKDMVNLPNMKKGPGAANPVKMDVNKPFKGKITLLKNTEKAPNLGARFGQDVEPAGFYSTQKETNYNDDLDNYKTFEIEIKKPLMIDVSKDLVQWKRDMATKYKAKGKKLSDKLKAEGYDSIITVDSGGYTGEIIVLNTDGLNEIDVKSKK